MPRDTPSSFASALLVHLGASCNLEIKSALFFKLFLSLQPTDLVDVYPGALSCASNPIIYRLHLKPVFIGYFLRRATALNLGNYFRANLLLPTFSSHISTLLQLDKVFKITGTWHCPNDRNDIVYLCGEACGARPVVRGYLPTRYWLESTSQG